MKNKEKQLDKIIKLITELLNDCCVDCGEKQTTTQQLIIQSVIWGSQNGYEGIGILEASKQEWLDILEEQRQEDLTCS